MVFLPPKLCWAGVGPPRLCAHSWLYWAQPWLQAPWTGITEHWNRKQVALPAWIHDGSPTHRLLGALRGGPNLEVALSLGSAAGSSSKI